MSADNGGTAFPERTYEYDGQNNVLPYDTPGMTLRDYFAAKALPIAFDYFRRIDSTDAGGSLNDTYDFEWENGDINTVAEYAYALADAMLAKRAKS
jgi:hypothetical protein